MSDATLDYEAEYNARRAVPEHPAILARWAETSSAVRSRLPCRIDLAYGPDPGERLDWFPAPGDAPRPLLYFVHGGYWRTLDKADFTFLVPALQELGLDVVLVNYGLCPRVTVAEIVAQVRRGLAWTHAHAAGLGADPGRLYLAGHSAGGHLVAMLLATDWAAEGCAEVGTALRGGLAVSGLYDLAPLLGTTINVEARLDAVTARELSPLFAVPTVDAALAVAVGGDESAEFHRQAEIMATSWPGASGPHVVAGANHFTVLDALATPGGPLHRRLRDLCA